MTDDFIAADLIDAKRKALFGGFQRLSNEIKDVAVVVQNPGMEYTTTEYDFTKLQFDKYKEKLEILKKYVLDFVDAGIEREN